MDHSNPVPARAICPTDTLINGLVGGILAGLGMLAWLLLAGLLAGEAPQALVERFVIPGQQPNPVSSIFLRLGGIGRNLRSPAAPAAALAARRRGAGERAAGLAGRADRAAEPG